MPDVPLLWRTQDCEISGLASCARHVETPSDVTIRRFIAIEMHRSVEDAAREVIAELRDRAGRLAPQARITWGVPDRLHVTVRFIGEANEARALAIRSALGATIDASVFDVTVEGVGAFPPKGPPRVLWAGLTDGRTALLDVERAVAGRVDAFVAAEERP